MNDSKVKEIIVQAFSEGGFSPVGNATLQEEMQEALPRLNSLLFSMVGLELGEKYSEWPVPPNRASSIAARYPLHPLDETLTRDQYLNPPANVRIVASNTEALTVYFPQAPLDGARMSYVDAGATADLTIHGNGRLVQGLASITGRGGDQRWFYRADKGNWICLKQLTMLDDMPLPPEFDDLFITGLIVRLSPKFKAEPSGIVASRFTDMVTRLKRRYAQSQGMPAMRTSEFPHACEI